MSSSEKPGESSISWKSFSRLHETLVSILHEDSETNLSTVLGSVKHVQYPSLTIGVDYFHPYSAKKPENLKSFKTSKGETIEFVDKYFNEQEKKEVTIKDPRPDFIIELSSRIDLDAVHTYEMIDGYMEWDCLSHPQTCDFDMSTKNSILKRHKQRVTFIYEKDDLDKVEDFYYAERLRFYECLSILARIASDPAHPENFTANQFMLGLREDGDSEKQDRKYAFEKLENLAKKLSQKDLLACDQERILREQTAILEFVVLFWAHWKDRAPSAVAPVKLLDIIHTVFSRQQEPAEPSDDFYPTLNRCTALFVLAFLESLHLNADERLPNAKAIRDKMLPHPGTKISDRLPTELSGPLCLCLAALCLPRTSADSQLASTEEISFLLDASAQPGITFFCNICDTSCDLFPFESHPHLASCSRSLSYALLTRLATSKHPQLHFLEFPTQFLSSCAFLFSLCSVPSDLSPDGSGMIGGVDSYPAKSFLADFEISEIGRGSGVGGLVPLVHDFLKWKFPESLPQLISVAQSLCVDEESAIEAFKMLDDQKSLFTILPTQQSMMMGQQQQQVFYEQVVTQPGEYFPTPHLTKSAFVDPKTSIAVRENTLLLSRGLSDDKSAGFVVVQCQVRGLLVIMERLLRLLRAMSDPTRESEVKPTRSDSEVQEMQNFSNLVREQLNQSAATMSDSAREDLIHRLQTTESQLSVEREERSKRASLFADCCNILGLLASGITASKKVYGIVNDCLATIAESGKGLGTTARRVNSSISLLLCNLLIKTCSRSLSLPFEVFSELASSALRAISAVARHDPQLACRHLLSEGVIQVLSTEIPRQEVPACQFNATIAMCDLALNLSRQQCPRGGVSDQPISASAAPTPTDGDFVGVCLKSLLFDVLCCGVLNQHASWNFGERNKHQKWDIPAKILKAVNRIVNSTHASKDPLAVLLLDSFYRESTLISSLASCLDLCGPVSVQLRAVKTHRTPELRHAFVVLHQGLRLTHAVLAHAATTKPSDQKPSMFLERAFGLSSTPIISASTTSSSTTTSSTLLSPKETGSSAFFPTTSHQTSPLLPTTLFHLIDFPSGFAASQSVRLMAVRSLTFLCRMSEVLGSRAPSILALLRDDAELVVARTAARVQSSSERVQLRAAIFDFVSAAVETQRGLADIFLSKEGVENMPRVSGIDVILGILKTLKAPFVKCPNLPVMDAALRVFETVWNSGDYNRIVLRLTTSNSASASALAPPTAAFSPPLKIGGSGSAESSGDLGGPLIPVLLSIVEMGDQDWKLLQEYQTRPKEFFSELRKTKAHNRAKSAIGSEVSSRATSPIASPSKEKERAEEPTVQKQADAPLINASHVMRMMASALRILTCHIFSSIFSATASAQQRKNLLKRIQALPLSKFLGTAVAVFTPPSEGPKETPAKDILFSPLSPGRSSSASPSNSPSPLSSLELLIAQYITTLSQTSLSIDLASMFTQGTTNGAELNYGLSKFLFDREKIPKREKSGSSSATVETPLAVGGGWEAYEGISRINECASFVHARSVFLDATCLLFQTLLTVRASAISPPKQKAESTQTNKLSLNTISHILNSHLQSSSRGDCAIQSEFPKKEVEICAKLASAALSHDFCAAAAATGEISNPLVKQILTTQNERRTAISCTLCHLLREHPTTPSAPSQIRQSILRTLCSLSFPLAPSQSNDQLLSYLLCACTMLWAPKSGGQEKEKEREAGGGGSGLMFTPMKTPSKSGKEPATPASTIQFTPTTPSDGFKIKSMIPTSSGVNVTSPGTPGATPSARTPQSSSKTIQWAVDPKILRTLFEVIQTGTANGVISTQASQALSLLSLLANSQAQPTATAATRVGGLSNPTPSLSIARALSLYAPHLLTHLFSITLGQGVSAEELDNPGFSALFDFVCATVSRLLSDLENMAGVGGGGMEAVHFCSAVLSALTSNPLLSQRVNDLYLLRSADEQAFSERHPGHLAWCSSLSLIAHILCSCGESISNSSKSDFSSEILGFATSCFAFINTHAPRILHGLSAVFKAPQGGDVTLAEMEELDLCTKVICSAVLADLDLRKKGITQIGVPPILIATVIENMGRVIDLTKRHIPRPQSLNFLPLSTMEKLSVVAQPESASGATSKPSSLTQLASQSTSTPQLGDAHASLSSTPKTNPTLRRTSLAGGGGTPNPSGETPISASKILPELLLSSQQSSEKQILPHSRFIFDFHRQMDTLSFSILRNSILIGHRLGVFRAEPQVTLVPQLGTPTEKIEIRIPGFHILRECLTACKDKISATNQLTTGENQKLISAENGGPGIDRVVQGLDLVLKTMEESLIVFCDCVVKYQTEILAVQTEGRVTYISPAAAINRHENTTLEVSVITSILNQLHENLSTPTFNLQPENLEMLISTLGFFSKTTKKLREAGLTPAPQQSQDHPSPSRDRPGSVVSTPISFGPSGGPAFGTPSRPPFRL